MDQRYPLNKGLGRPVEFKGLVGQYIFYLVGTVLGAFFAFIVMYLIGVSTYLCILLTLGLGLFGISRVFSLNAKYGEHGAMKASAKARQPQVIVSRNARLFKDLKRHE